MDDLGEFRDREKREGGIDASTGVRAAQYVRMSTEHQRYSTENQADIIAQYAARRCAASYWR